MAPGALVSAAQRSLTPTRLRGTLAEKIRKRNATKHRTSPLLSRNAKSKSLLLIDVDGIRLTVTDGEKVWKILDASGGAAVSNIGHGDQRIKDAEDQLWNTTRISYAASMDFTTEIVNDCAEYLLATMDWMMSKVVFYDSGSAANEAAKKIILQYFAKEKQTPEPERTLFIARHHSYHGTTAGALASSGHSPRRVPFKSNIPDDTHFVSACRPYRDLQDGMTESEYVQQLAQEMEDKIVALGSRKVAAVFIEPVVGAALGCVSAVHGYLIAMREVCDRYGVLLVFDEVMCGMGRTGRWHAWQAEMVVPDVQVVGKGLAGGYAEISAMILGYEIADAFENGSGNGAFNHGHTFQNYPRACVSALRTMMIIDEDNLLGNIQEKGDLLRRKLRDGLSSHPNVGDIRGVCGFQGIEFVLDKTSKNPFPSGRNVAWRLHELGLTPEHGVYVYPGTGSADLINGDHIIIAPAYNITENDVNEIAKRVIKLINDFFDVETTSEK